ncbi:MAG: RNA polymerase subunit sigma-70 [Alphaproteobacteria bacterium]|nr:RNA polymerase subunit sigma-70 [Alphaproteobacteria bacterium]
MSTLAEQLPSYRPVLRAHCYRMLGHPQDADEAVQDTLLRAVRALDRFEGRASLKTWLVRIATRVCLDAAERRRRMPTQSPAGTPMGPFEPTSPDEWVAPIPHDWVPTTEPAVDEQVAIRGRVDLALVTLLQELPARQRAAVLLADVFDWTAAEVAETLEWTPAGVNSALQRARARLDGLPPRPATVEPAVVARYRDAFARYDVDALVALLSDDVAFDMPPIPLWLRGSADVSAFLRGPGAECRGSIVVPVRGSGLYGFAQYRNRGRTPWALVLLEARGERITAVHSFLDTAALFPLFGAPPRIDEVGAESAMRM